ncbi:MAG TPA: EAL domain-containing protein [Pyrinomonadaceae bacterium]|nr:EAL domain-containing protein [Pyrinomonadaceae bacterium]
MKSVSQKRLSSASQPVSEFLNELTEELDSGRKATPADQQARAQLRAVFDNNLTGVCFSNFEGTISKANEAFLRSVGYAADVVAAGSLNWRDITAKPFRHLDDRALEQLVLSATCQPYEKEYVASNGRNVPVLCSLALTNSDQEIVCFSFDLTEYKKQLNHLAYHDALTTLPNQALLKDRLQQAIALARLNEQMLAVMLVNLDRFKIINDTLGYVTADQLLQEVATRLSSCVRDSDTVARLGSDEFALLLTQVGRAEDAVKVAQCIKDVLESPFHFAGQELFVQASIGISLHPDDGSDAMALLKTAGTALNRAKEQGGNDYQFYTSGRTTRALRQLVLENNFRPGLEREEFVVYYQPQVNIESCQIVGIEALVRWQHPGLGLLYPKEFIRMAEESGLIVSLGEWVLRAACVQSKSWQDAGFEPLRLAINLSARQFQQPRLIPIIEQIVTETGLDPRYLEFELTEGSVMKDPDEAIKKLNELKQMGVTISIDDFGTGYSSLNYLKRFPIDTLKIDQSFVREISTDPEVTAIVTAIITLAHALKLNVIAEGVETEEQLKFLRSLGCDEVQGFLFSKPISADEFTAMLIERSEINSQRNYNTNPLPTPETVAQPKR